MVLSTLLNVEPGLADAAITRLFDEAAIEVVPVTDAIAQETVAAFARYGKGRGHPARLNLADCLIYASARANNAPLLFLGDDFSQTDIATAPDAPRPTSAQDSA
jgi:ribonuclease VapC